jgi:hypothetical protein
MTDLVPVTRTIVDTADRLEHYLRTASADGRLVTAPEDIRATAMRSGHYAVTVTVREPAASLTRRQRSAAFERRHPILVPCMKALTFAVIVLGLVAGVLFAIGLLIMRTVDLRTLGGFLIAALVLTAVAFGRSGGSHSGHKGEGFHWSKCK